MQGNSKSESDWQVSTATKNMKYYSLLDLSRELCLFWLIYKFSFENLYQKHPLWVKMFLIYMGV